MVDLIDRLNTLIKQDREKYQKKDYLDPGFQHRLLEANAVAADSVAPSNSSTTSSQSSGTISECWREKICEWSYSLVDHYDYSREIVSISICLLDRYLSVCCVDKRNFQLAAMTTLYMTIKIYERGALSINSLIELSRGYFSPATIIAQEASLLEALDWYISPPTAFCIGRHFLHMIPVSSEFPLTVRHDVLEHTRFLCELSVIDYFFVTKRASSVGLAALLNAIDCNLNFPSDHRVEFLKQLERLDDFDPNDAEIGECRDRLRELYIQGGYGPPSTVDYTEMAQRQEAVSPVSVANAFNAQGQVQSEAIASNGTSKR